jgi:trimeric autotransporter adhesin
MLNNYRSVRWLFVLTLSAAAVLISLTTINQAAAQDNGPQSPQVATGSGFTYQGRLIKNGQAISDTCALSLSLWDAVSGGSFLNSNTFNTVPISNGLFTVQIDYGSSTFNGEARWIETAVKCTGDANYVTLSPRTKLTPTPYAMYALNNWALNGNSGTNGNGFIGTTDNTALTIGVNGTGALRIYPNPTSPNLVGGYSGNLISPTLYGQTIAGGGSFFYENQVLKTYGTVGGGQNNQVDGYAATIAGGAGSRATSDYATIAGGLNNLATGSSSGIGGGFYNVAAGYVAYVGGGDLNLAMTQNATIGGGYSNTITGGQLIANNTIGGGVFNFNSGFAATIAGGHGNQATGEWSAMGGGGFNTASGRSTTVSGGEYNIAAGAGSTIGGGGWNGGATSGNQARGAASTIAGGYGNFISSDAGYGVIAGGQQNIISNTPGSNLNIATIGGGYNNRVTLGGGTVGGGNSNNAGNFDATVAGGNSNSASGGGSIIPGGIGNLAQGNTSFAAGNRAKSYNNGCFTWADSANFDFACGLNNAFTARATGGVYFVTAINGSGASTAGVQVPAGSNAWSALSDRNSKANFALIDGRAVVEKLARIPISTWNYKTQAASIRHIGPMAQDFAAAFSVGEDNTHISTIDADGVSLAAIQGLYQLSQDKDQQIAQLQARLEALENHSNPIGSAAPTGLIWFIAGAVIGLGAFWLGMRRASGRAA